MTAIRFVRSEDLGPRKRRTCIPDCEPDWLVVRTSVRALGKTCIPRYEPGKEGLAFRTIEPEGLAFRTIEPSRSPAMMFDKIRLTSEFLHVVPAT